jgi:hypothetical protein
MEIGRFPLAWRWTSQKHARLPQDVLSKIVPLPVDESTRLHKASVAFLDQSGLNAERFSVVELKTSEAKPEDVTSWLLERHPEQETPVCLSWQSDLAVTTTWGVFAKYWSEFCYPASDDLLVCAVQCRWVLLYRHDELMQHGTSRLPETP